MIASPGSLEKRMLSIFGGVVDLIQYLLRSGDRDPHQNIEKWLDIEECIGATSSFFFWPGFNTIIHHHHSDCLYNLSDNVMFQGQGCSVSEMIREIDRKGWEIGLHPSWYSYDDIDELRRQKDALENILGHDLVSVRQHNLHYDIQVTPVIHSEAGFLYDSTLGFNDNVGFRFGTSYPWHLTSLSKNELLPIIEIPLIIQDSAMLNPNKGMRIDANMAFRYIELITDAIENVGGVLTLSWHPQYHNMEAWWELYDHTLTFLKKKNPWFATVRQVGEWFKKENSEILCRYSKGFE